MDEPTLISPQRTNLMQTTDNLHRLAALHYRIVATNSEGDHAEMLAEIHEVLAEGGEVGASLVESGAPGSFIDS